MKDRDFHEDIYYVEWNHKHHKRVRKHDVCICVCVQTVYLHMFQWFPSCPSTISHVSSREPTAQFDSSVLPPIVVQ